MNFEKKKTFYNSENSLEWLLNKKYLVQGGRQAVGMIGSGAGGARDKVFAGLLATDETVLYAGGLVDALVAVPVAIGDLIDGWFEAVCVISLVTTEINFSGVFCLYGKQ